MQQAVMQRPCAWIPASWTMGLLTAFLVATNYISQHVPDSYMDEPFHVPMAQQYCRGDFVTWDPKITTFPGIYYLGSAYAWASYLLLSWAGASLEATCSGPFLRSLNALLAVVCIQLAYALSVELQQQQRQVQQNHQQQQGQEQQEKALGVALVLGLLPTQLFFAFLFYTDVPALLFLLLTELLLVRGATYAAAAAGAAAIGVRQTNAVWVTFLTGAAMLQCLLAQQQQQRGKSENGASRQAAASPGSKAPAAASKLSQPSTGGLGQQQQGQHPVAELVQLVGTAWRIKRQLLADFWLLLLLPIAFCAFVAWNGSITLGDKEAHAPSAHLMQPLYFGAFCLLIAALLLLQPAVLKATACRLKAQPLLSCMCLGLATTAGCLLAARYSLAHPYLLADNRHYTFYIWRKIINPHWAARYCWVPVYVVSWVLLLAGLLATQHWLWVAAYVASCCVTLVPAWLIEFRYFTAPFALALLHLPAPPKLASLLTAATFCCVNVATLYVFAQRPYAWADGSVARFMW